MKTITKFLLIVTVAFLAGCGRSTMKVKLDSCQGMKTPLGWAECEEWHD